MAEIELEYNEYRCVFEQDEVGHCCYENWQSYVSDSCRHYKGIESDRLCDDVCQYVSCVDRYVGANTNSYDIQLPDNVCEYPYASVRIGRKWYYDVTKVTLNGKVVFDCG